MRSSSSGFLLLLLGAIALIGYLTGNLDRWLAYLFSAGGTPVVDVAPSSQTGKVLEGVASANRRTSPTGATT